MKIRGLVSLLLLAGASAFAQNPDANDVVWQKSVSQFDSRRKALLQQVDKEAKQGPFRPDWPSLERYTIPDWYQDAKFGIFLHWGVYAVPAFGNEWYPRNMYGQGRPEYQHQIENHGPETAFGYKDYIPLFQAQHFDPNAWARLFEQSGAKYVIPVAEHHDGFAMYDSDLSVWTAARMGPKRDTVGELAAAVRAQGLHFGVSTHRIEHYFFMNGGREHPSDVQDARYAAFYGPAHAGVTDRNGQKWAAHPDGAFLDDWLARTAEIVNKYRPDVVYFDWWINTKEVAPYLQRFASFYYNEAAARHATAVIDYKNTAFPEGAAVLDIERGQLEAPRKLFWQTDTSISVKSWGYVENDTFRSPESLIGELVDVVSKNGALLLNIGPKPDGTIPDQAAQILAKIGTWLAVNGEAIYGTRPWSTFGEGPTRVEGGAFHDAATAPYSSQDIRFTTKGKTLYAIALGWPADGKLTVKSLAKDAPGLATEIRHVDLLGSQRPIEWTRDATGLKLQLPSKRVGEYAYVFKIS